MPLRVTFELTDADLRHFQLIMREARSAAANISRDDILDAATSLLEEVRESKVPDFIRERLEKLETMINMVTDPEWQLPPKETTRALNALAYFGEPEDLIPDHIPGLGFLDDAIMVELVVRELKHEIEAYEDFCRYRNREEQRQPGQADATVTREAWLKTRRQELHSRMRRRRRADRTRRRKRGTKTKSPFSLL
jgi:uncharacterized membrane protein YkvA (DUF1232 family)